MGGVFDPPDPPESEDEPECCCSEQARIGQDDPSPDCYYHGVDYRSLAQRRADDYV